MKAKFRHIYEVIAGAILSLLGLGGCEELSNIIDAPAEYGEPHATYKLIGSVSADDTGDPLEGIRVKYRRYYYTDENGEDQFMDYEYTSGKDGKVNKSFSEFPMYDGMEKHQIVLEDIDGEEGGGKFLPDTLRGEDIKMEYDDSDAKKWYFGTYTLSFEAKLTRDISEDE